MRFRAAILHLLRQFHSCREPPHLSGNHQSDTPP